MLTKTFLQKNLPITTIAADNSLFKYRAFVVVATKVTPSRQSKLLALVIADHCRFTISLQSLLYLVSLVFRLPFLSVILLVFWLSDLSLILLRALLKESHSSISLASRIQNNSFWWKHSYEKSSPVAVMSITTVGSGNSLSSHCTFFASGDDVCTSKGDSLRLSKLLDSVIVGSSRFPVGLPSLPYLLALMLLSPGSEFDPWHFLGWRGLVVAFGWKNPDRSLSLVDPVLDLLPFFSSFFGSGHLNAAWEEVSSTGWSSDSRLTRTLARTRLTLAAKDELRWTTSGL